MTGRTLLGSVLLTLFLLAMGTSSAQAQRMHISSLQAFGIGSDYGGGPEVRFGMTALGGIYLGGLLSHHQGAGSSTLSHDAYGVSRLIIDETIPSYLGGEVGYEFRRGQSSVQPYAGLGVVRYLYSRRDYRRNDYGYFQGNFIPLDNRDSAVDAFVAPGITIYLSLTESIAIGAGFRYLFSDISSPMLAAGIKFTPNIQRRRAGAVGLRGFSFGFVCAGSFRWAAAARRSKKSKRMGYWRVLLRTNWSYRNRRRLWGGSHQQA